VILSLASTSNARLWNIRINQEDAILQTTDKKTNRSVLFVVVEIATPLA
jgi:hypothetical protein